MTIKEIADLITAKNFVFQISIPGSNFVHGKTTINMALSDSESVYSYLSKIAEANKARHLLVKVFSPNGSSYKQRGEHLIFLPSSEPVAVTTNVATPATPVAKNETNNANELAGIESQVAAIINKQTPKPAMMTDKDYIDFKVLQSEHKRLEEMAAESKSKIAKLEKKIEDLHDENKSLLRENTVKDDRHALQLERTKLDIEKEGKEGLSGLVGELTKDPDNLKMLIGLFKPDHPMFREQAAPKELEGLDGNSDIHYVQDAEANQVLNALPRDLSKQTPDTIGKVFLIIQKIITNPEEMKKAVQIFVPELTN